jgi:hypothetical protein
MISKAAPICPIQTYYRTSNLLRTLEPAAESPSVAPRVAGSNPVAHPNLSNNI